MSDLIDRKEMLRTYQYICDGVKCSECVQFLKSETGECPIERWINNLSSVSTELSNNSPKLDNKNGELISRQDAIDSINAYLGLSAVSRTIQNMTSIQEILEKLPPASPDLSTFSDKLWKIAYERGKEEGQKKGKWIYGEKSGQDGWYCSECGGFIPWDYDFYGLDNIDFIEEFKTCPFCDSKMVSYTGADMEEGEEE